jgi:hypothetical protein
VFYIGEIMETLNEKVLHRDELNRQLASAKAHRDELLVDYIQTHPEMSYHEIGRMFGLVAEHVSLIARNNNVRRLRGRRSGFTLCRR